MDTKEIINAIFHIFFLVYGILGILGIGPVPTATVLATYMIIYYGVRYGLFEIRVKKGMIDEKVERKKDNQG